MATYKGTKYSLTADQLKRISRLCTQEQGSVAGSAAEASLMANLYELVGKKKYSSLYDYVRNGGWFYRAAYYMDNGGDSTAIRNAVKDVLVNGNRTVPLYIDEHDCFSDIKSATNNGKAIKITDRSAYKQGVTVIKNRYGSTYTFWCFPASTSDPFGYTANSRAPKSGTASSGSASSETMVDLTVSLPQISEGSKGTAVQIWESLIQTAVTGNFDSYLDEKTKAWQKKQGLTADGIVGPKTWAAGFKSIT